jgi:hypothetical protein
MKKSEKKYLVVKPNEYNEEIGPFSSDEATTKITDLLDSGVDDFEVEVYEIVGDKVEFERKTILKEVVRLV